MQQLALPSDFPPQQEELYQAAKAVLAVPPLLPGDLPTPLTPGHALLPTSAPRLIGISGYPRSGKDVIAGYLFSRYADVVRINFSDTIIDEVNAWLFRYGRRITEVNKSEKVHRALLQAWGMARREQDSYYWSKHVAASVQRAWQRGARLVIVCGLRTADDLLAIKQLDGEHWHVVRPGSSYRSDHQLEKAVDVIRDGAEELVNSEEGDFALLHNRVEYLLAQQTS